MSTADLFLVGFAVTLILAAALALLVYAAIADGRDAAARRLADPSGPVTAKSLLEVARATGEFSTLALALDRAGLAHTLLDGGPYTVFAPNDEAFAKLPDGVVDSLLASREELAAILTYHVVPGRMTAAEVAARRSAPTVQGEDLCVSNNGAIRIDGARVVSRDIEAANGVIHAIDRVLLPARI